MLQGAWGKRGWTPDDEWALTEISDNEPQYDEYSNLPSDFEESFDEEKRKWQSLTPSWGKRATDWESFRGLCLINIDTFFLNPKAQDIQNY